MRTPLSPLAEGRGAVTDLSSVPANRTTDNFAFEGLNMHERWVRAGGEYRHCVTLFPTPKIQHIHTVPSSNRWEDVSERRAPPFSPLSASPLRTAGRQTFLLLSFQRKTKECVGPLLHTRACVQTHTYTHPHPKKLSMRLWADHISAAWAGRPASRGA